MRSPWICSIVLFAMLLAAALFCHSTAQASDKAPDFELYDMYGTRHKLADYLGKVVLINFWVSWCPECIEEMPSLNALYENHKGKGLIVLGVSADRKKESVLPVISRARISFPVLLDTTGGLFIRQYTVVGLPTTVVIDKKGFINERIIGRTDFGAPSFVKKIESLTGTRQ